MLGLFAAAAVLMYGSYVHAKRAGQASSAPGTEDTNTPGRASGLAWGGAMNNPT